MTLEQEPSVVEGMDLETENEPVTDDSAEIDADSDEEETAEDPSIGFDQLGLAPEILEALAQMEYQTPTEVQAAVIPLALERKDLMVQSRTGTGKTAAFGVPIVQGLLDTDVNDVRALVLAPTRELAIQVANECTRIAATSSVGVTAIYGGAAMAPQIDALKGGTHLVVGTPGRVLDHIRRKNLRTGAINTLVLDEGDEMLSMGFKEEITAIIDQLPTERQTMIFSATIPDEIRRLVDTYCNDPVPLMLSEDFIGVREINHVYYLVSGGDRPRDLMQVLRYEEPGIALIFCNTREDTAHVADFLRGQGFKAEGISSDLTQRERERVMSRMRNGELRFLVATDVAARGIDLSDLTHVINYSFPESADVYVHRTGRTGRAGKSGTAVSLVSPREIGSFYYLKLIHKIYPEERHLPSAAELATRREGERYERLLAMMNGKEVTEEMRSLARRTWSTLDGERVMALALAAVLDEMDEVFAAVTPAVRPKEQEGSRRESAEPRRTESDRGRRGERPGRRTEGRRGERREGRREGRGDGRRGDRRDRGPSRDRNDSRPPKHERKLTRTRRRDPDGAQEQGAFTTPDGDVEYWETVEEGASAPTDAVRLFLNLGRRQGFRKSELSEYLAAEAELPQEQLHGLHIRDNFSFITVAATAVDHVIEKLNGKQIEDREVRVERAKTSGDGG